MSKHSPSAEAPFPAHFYWGAGTAAHQVDGGHYNDWTEFETRRAPFLAMVSNKDADFGNGPLPNEAWLRIESEARDPSNYISGNGVDHRRRYPEDLEVLKGLGGNAYRFSLEWSWIEPEPGKFNQAALDHYQRMLVKMGEVGLKPFITLHHFTNPRWFSEAGGWTNRAAPQYFERYASRMAEELADADAIIGTINEPNVYALTSHWIGERPPEEHRATPFRAYHVMATMAEAHERSYEAFKRINSHTPVAAIMSITDYHAAANWRRPMNQVAAAGLHAISNMGFYRQSHDMHDYYGINTYMQSVVDGTTLFANDSSMPRSDLGWYLAPESLGNVVRALPRDGRPIYVTEHGLADSRDHYREWFTRESLKGLGDAMMDGAQVRGYLAWSLLDNFEWEKGWWPKFGLISVDRTTMERTVKPSTYSYAKIMGSNGRILYDLES